MISTFQIFMPELIVSLLIVNVDGVCDSMLPVAQIKPCYIAWNSDNVLRPLPHGNFSTILFPQNDYSVST